MNELIEAMGKTTVTHLWELQAQSERAACKKHLENQVRGYFEKDTSSNFECLRSPGAVDLQIINMNVIYGLYYLD